VNKFVRLAIGGLLLGVIAWKTDWEAVRQSFAQLQIGWWLAAAGLLLGTQLVSAWRWKCFADALRFRWPFSSLTGFYFIGMWFNLVLPTAVGGDVVRAWYLNARSGRKLAALASVILDRLSGLIVLVSLACVGTVLCPLTLPAWMPLSVAAIGAGLLAGLVALPFLARWGLLPHKRRQQLLTMEHILRSPRVLLATTLSSLFVQVANVAMVWMLGRAIAADVPASFYWIAVPMVSLLTMLPVSVNGMGLREGGMVLFLTPLGVSSGQALTLAFLWFAVYVAVSLLGGVVYLVGRFPKPQPTATEVSADGPVDRDPDQGRVREYSQAV
jgi:uncharacterized membrane protein YbhN (UPF0104 family)